MRRIAFGRITNKNIAQIHFSMTREWERESELKKVNKRATKAQLLSEQIQQKRHKN